jgi:hypothetical protein
LIITTKPSVKGNTYIGCRSYERLKLTAKTGGSKNPHACALGGSGEGTLKAFFLIVNSRIKKARVGGNKCHAKTMMHSETSEAEK